MSLPAGSAEPCRPFDSSEPSSTDNGEAGGLPASIFRAYDIRGVVGETLTPRIVCEIGRAIGSEAVERGQPEVVVGRDGRDSSLDLGEALVEGLRSAGRNVVDVGAVPTPVLYYATLCLGTGSGVMVTGSHNPANYNGLKIMLGGDTLSGEEIVALRTRVGSGRLRTGVGACRREEVVDAYLRQVVGNVAPARDRAFKVVIDCGNGIAGGVAPRLVRALGHEVVPLYCDVDGRFPNHHPDPGDPDNLRVLIETVRERGADLGLAFDGDGDRLGVVDATGNVIWPDRLLMLFAADLLSRDDGAEIVFDVKCSRRLAEVIRSRGGVPVMWKTGHSFIKKKLKELSAPLAGEMSGHIFFADRWYGFDDALYASARLLEILIGDERPPGEVFAEFPGGVSTPELKIAMQEGRQHRFVEDLLRHRHMLVGNLTSIDGLRVDYPDGWGLVRASNTTPALVLRFEGDDPEALARIQTEFGNALRSLDPDLELPFPVTGSKPNGTPGAGQAAGNLPEAT